ncbi:MAG: PHP domain-containing protein [Ignavibacteriae bacterium]|nr:PHP domain-containing protein [Ignavibacteriota bacterium]
MDAKADLHTHTIYSDGALSPYELITKAKSVGLETISITDHDSVSGLDEADDTGKKLNVEVVPGVELSASFDGEEVHILGYFIDYRSQSLLSALDVFRKERIQRAERIVDKLNQINIPLKLESVFATSKGNSIGRPHIATALVNEGHAESYYDAFNKYIGDGRPAYERKMAFSVEETLQLITGSGGLSFLAHPGRLVSEKMLFQIIKAGLDGIEVVHPSHSPDLIRYYRGIVNEYSLLESGGSDFHGGLKNDEGVLGQFGISVSAVETIRRRLIAN